MIYSRFSRCTLIFPGFPGRMGTLTKIQWALTSIQNQNSPIRLRSLTLSYIYGQHPFPSSAKIHQEKPVLQIVPLVRIWGDNAVHSYFKSSLLDDMLLFILLPCMYISIVQNGQRSSRERSMSPVFSLVQPVTLFSPISTYNIDLWRVRFSVPIFLFVSIMCLIDGSESHLNGCFLAFCS